MNTYEKHRGEGALLLTKHPMRMFILSERSESKDLSSHATKDFYRERPSGAEGSLIFWSQLRGVKKGVERNC
jgi:hypothetical protein